MIKRPSNSSISTLKKFTNSSIKKIKPIDFWDGISYLGQFEFISTTTVGSGGTTDVTFSSIPQTYTHLQIRGIHRSASTDGALDFQFNGDTATNYARHSTIGNGASASGAATVPSAFGRIVGSAPSTSGSNIFGSFVFDILDYTNTNKFKTTRSIGGYDNNGSGQIDIRSSLWRSTAAITSIKIYNSSGNNLAQYSSFALYGINA